MGMGPHQFATTPLDNQTADARGQWPVGIPAKAVDAAARGNMATIALARDDNLGVLVAVLGPSNVYSVNTGQGLVDPASQAGGQVGKITHPFSLKLRFSAALAGSATNAPRLKVDGVDCGPLLRCDGSALADGDLSTTAPVEILGDMAASGDTSVTRVRVLALTPGELAAIVKAAAPGAPVGALMQRPGRGITLPDGYLLANGALVSRTAYADLWAYAQAEQYVNSDAGWPNTPCAFSAGDGSATFRIPDLRGEFLRGLDLGRGVDPGRDAATVQSDAFRYHQHQTVTDGGLFFIGGGLQLFNPGIGQGSYANQWSTGGSGGSETRPRNAAAPIFIKY